MSKLENKNAVKHGAFAVFLIMPDEDPNCSKHSLPIW